MAPIRSRDRLRVLLWILVVTTVLVIAQQALRWRYGRLNWPVSSGAPEADSGVDLSVAADENMLPVQFDEDGELDLGTMERMLDILYKRPQDMDGYEALEADSGSYRFRKNAAPHPEEL